MNDLSSKTVLVTGATDGLGRGVVRALAARGATVLVHGRDRARAEGLALELSALGATAARVVALIVRASSRRSSSRWILPPSFPKYFGGSREAKANAQAYDQAARAKFRELSERLAAR